MKNKNSIWIIFIIAIGVIAGLFIFLGPSVKKIDTEEIKPVNWRQGYNSQDKSPYGTYIFYELLRKYSIDNKHAFNSDAELPKLNTLDAKQPKLLVAVNKKYDLYDKHSREIFEFVKNGNYAFISAYEFSYFFHNLITYAYEFDSEVGKKIELSFLQSTDSGQATYPLYFYFGGKKTTHTWQVLKAKLTSGSYENQNENENENENEEEEYDDEVIYTEKSGYDDDYADEYLEYDEDYSSTEVDYTPIFDEEAFGTAESIEKSANGNIVFCKLSYGKGAFYIHTVPISFANISLLNEKNVEHVERILSYLPSTDLVWQKLYQDETEEDQDGNSQNNSGKAKQSPLQFILSVPPLKWAYFLMLITLFLYIAFRIKRKARAIPAKQKNENNSLEFAEAVSQLYFQKGEHRSILQHKEKLFYHFVREKYFLNKKEKEDELIRLLSIKSQIDETIVKAIVELFKKANTTIPNEQLLIDIHERTTYFYKNCK